MEPSGGTMVHTISGGRPIAGKGRELSWGTVGGRPRGLG